MKAGRSMTDALICDLSIRDPEMLHGAFTAL